MNKPYVLGMDIGGTHLRLGAVGRDGEAAGFETRSSRALFGGGDAVECLADIAATALSHLGGEPRGVCVGFPGTVQRDHATVLSCPNLPAFNGKDVVSALRERLDLPVRVEHDVVPLLRWDMHALELGGLETVAGIYFGTGVGNALFVNGRFLAGKNGVAGELGHIPTLGAEGGCPCGNPACIEPSASGKRLEAIHAEHFPQEPFDEIFSRHAQDAQVHRFLNALSIAAAVEVNLLDPDAVVLSGGIVHMRDFPWAALCQGILSHARKPLPAEMLVLLRGTQDAYAGVKGAGLCLWEALAG